MIYDFNNCETQFSLILNATLRRKCKQFLNIISIMTRFLVAIKKKNIILLLLQNEFIIHVIVFTNVFGVTMRY